MRVAPFPQKILLSGKSLEGRFSEMRRGEKLGTLDLAKSYRKVGLCSSNLPSVAQSSCGGRTCGPAVLIVLSRVTDSDGALAA